tara:strand:- start:89 stop:385 length:297 start_codon:yes stop_codon:yes gene_type:complete
MSRLQTTKEYSIKVRKTLHHVYVDVVNNKDQSIVATSSTLILKSKALNVESCKTVGKDIASKIKKLKISSLMFDRNGNKYHGKVKAIAEAAREEGLEF